MPHKESIQAELLTVCKMYRRAKIMLARLLRRWGRPSRPLSFPLTTRQTHISGSRVKMSDVAEVKAAVPCWRLQSFAIWPQQVLSLRELVPSCRERTSQPQWHLLTLQRLGPELLKPCESSWTWSTGVSGTWCGEGWLSGITQLALWPMLSLESHENISSWVLCSSAIAALLEEEGKDFATVCTQD